MRLERLGGVAAIALLATMGSASAVPCGGTCVRYGNRFHRHGAAGRDFRPRAGDSEFEAKYRLRPHDR